ncbi:MAG TPA: thiolase family protein [Gammaproteobacteria bacterium]|nr:thiolase family protein [Gammaproteobacteria bacterium]
MATAISARRPFLGAVYHDVWLLAGLRTPFADYNGTLGLVSPTDLGIAAAKAVITGASVDPESIEAVIASNMAQSSFDAYYLPRHIGLYAGMRIESPALGVQRLCGSGFEAIVQAADQLQLGKLAIALSVGAESMSRNPIAAYTHRGGFRMGGVDFRDFLWEATIDTAADVAMGHTAENLAKRYGIGREAVDAFAAESFARACRAWEEGYFEGEVIALESQVFERAGCRPRSLQLKRGIEKIERDEHVRPTTLETLARLRPAFGGVQTGGNSSAIVDGAAACLIGTSDYAREHGLKPMARIVAAAVAGVPPEIMGIGPAPAIRGVLELTGLQQEDISRFEINEAFAAQYLAVEKELGLDRSKVNVNGGAIAIGHPLGATGVRCTITLARELKRRKQRYGISSACAGGGQGIALLIENPAVA